LKKLFEKGNKAAVGKGRPSLPPELKAVQALTPTMIAKKISLFWSMTPEELTALQQDKSTSTLDATLIGIALKAMADNDHNRANFLLDRSAGKVKEQVEHSIVQPTIIQRLDGSVVELGQKVIEGEVEAEEGE